MRNDQMIDMENMNVLIVDDSINMCQSIQSMMKVINNSKRFFFANNGKEALEILNNEPVDLLMIPTNCSPACWGQLLVSRMLSRYCAAASWLTCRSSSGSDHECSC